MAMDVSLGRRELLVAGTAAALGVPLVAGCGGEDGATSSPEGATSSENRRTPVKHPAGLSYGAWLRPGSHVLDRGGSKAVLVEFLDFECEACGGVFPVIEQIRQEFKGELTYAIRYLPLPGHANARPAAYAVEAAARQGRLEPMYQEMFRNQGEWGEQQGPVDDTFTGFARTAGLDLGRWNSARASRSVAARVDADVKDAQALKLKGTPSFFLNGKPFSPESPDDLRRKLRDATK